VASLQGRTALAQSRNMGGRSTERLKPSSVDLLALRWHRRNIRN